VMETAVHARPRRQKETETTAAPATKKRAAPKSETVGSQRKPGRTRSEATKRKP
jgi:hypothetical protein